MLSTHLWKEWREQRGLLLTLMGLLVVLAGAAALLLTQQELLPAPSWLMRTGAAVGVVVLSSELVPGELRRGQLGWMLRLPSALRSAFVAKFVVLFAGTAVLAGSGAAFGSAVESMLFGPSWVSELSEHDYFVTLGPLFAFAPWAFAVSCWMPRSMLVVPAALLLLAPIVLPLALLARERSGLAPLVIGSTWSAVYFGGAGIVLAWLSFCRGLPRGRRSLVPTSMAMLLLLAPLGVAAGQRLYAWHHVDPKRETVEIHAAYLGAGGRLLFVDLQDRMRGNEGPYHTLVVDMETGTWRRHGDVMGSFQGSGALDGREFACGTVGPQELLVRYQATIDGKRALPPATIVDGRTGETLGAVGLAQTDAELQRRVRESRMATALLRDAAGRRVFFAQGTWYRESADGGTQPLEHVRDKPYAVCGAGVRLAGGEHGQQRVLDRVFDPLRNRVFEIPSRAGVFVLGDTWLFRETFTRPAPWVQYDPETGQRGAGLELAAHWPCMLDTQSVLDVDRQTGTLERVVAATGERSLIGVEGPAPRGMLTAVHAAFWRALGACICAPDGATVAMLSYSDPSRAHAVALAKIHDGRAVLTDMVTHVEAIGFTDSDSVIALVDSRRIERLRFGGGRELLFPR